MQTITHVSTAQKFVCVASIDSGLAVTYCGDQAVSSRRGGHMAGAVRTDRFTVPGTTVIHLIARQCPVTVQYGEVCQQYDPHSGEVIWCPFMYGLRIKWGSWHHGEARTPQDAATWMASDETSEVRSYTTLCLRQSSAATTHGATRIS